MSQKRSFADRPSTATTPSRPVATRCESLSGTFDNMADGGTTEGPFARITLDGTRFANARLPVDALSELQRYTTLLRDYAAKLWQDEHPGDTLPEDFYASFDLAITRIERGSAASLLDHPETDYDEYWEKSRDAIDAAFYAIVANSDTVDSSDPGEQGTQDATGITNDTDAEPLQEAVGGTRGSAAEFMATREEFRLFGSGLRPSESLLILPTDADTDSTDGTARPTVTISPATARPRFESIYLQHQQELLAAGDLVVAANEGDGPREKRVSTVAGRLYALNAESRNYRVHTLHHGSCLGRYSDASLTEDLKGMLGTSQSAPLVRITGRMSWNPDGSLYRILDSAKIELLDIAEEPWSRRFIELAGLPPEWHPDVSSQLISFDSIDAARHILRELRASAPPTTGQASIFPHSDGGILLEWSDGISVATIEVSPAPSFAGWRMNGEQDEEAEFEDASVDNAVTFIREAFA